MSLLLRQHCRRLVAPLLITAAFGLSQTTAHAIIATIGSSVAPPTTIQKSTPPMDMHTYVVTVTGTADGTPWYIDKVELYMATGTTTASTGTFVLFGASPSPTPPYPSTYSHAFTVYNTSTGNFWWKGLVDEKHLFTAQTLFLDSPELGPFTTN